MCYDISTRVPLIRGDEIGDYRHFIDNKIDKK